MNIFCCGITRPFISLCLHWHTNIPTTWAQTPLQTNCAWVRHSNKSFPQTTCPCLSNNEHRFLHTCDPILPFTCNVLPPPGMVVDILTRLKAFQKTGTSNFSFRLASLFLHYKYPQTFMPCMLLYQVSHAPCWEMRRFVGSVICLCLHFATLTYRNKKKHLDFSAETSPLYLFPHTHILETFY